jgi:hypothetical protein
MRQVDNEHTLRMLFEGWIGNSNDNDEWEQIQMTLLQWGRTLHSQSRQLPRTRYISVRCFLVIE